jgi:hypothetical protein
VEGNKFKLTFEPYKAVNKGINYTVSYIVVESPQRSYLRKTLRCSSTFFDINNPNTTFKESYINTTTKVHGSLTAEYEASYPHSYITIIPVLDPQPQNYTSKPSYEISELSIGKGPKFLQRIVSALLATVEDVTGITDDNMLNFVLIFSTVIINVLIAVACCWICNRYCRETIIVERKRLATSEREGRLARVSNSLDMLDANEPATEDQIRALP